MYITGTGSAIYYLISDASNIKSSPLYPPVSLVSPVFIVSIAFSLQAPASERFQHSPCCLEEVKIMTVFFNADLLQCNQTETEESFTFFAVIKTNFLQIF